MKDNALKFLIRQMPPAEYLPHANTRLVTQAYITVRENFELKALKMTFGEMSSYSLVSKTTNGKNRQRTDVEISVQQYDFLKNIPDLRMITKKRTAIIDGDYLLKFDDFFEGTTLGIICILELDVVPTSSKKAEDYIFPDLLWAKGRVDVSDDARYFNQNLALLKK